MTYFKAIIFKQYTQLMEYKMFYELIHNQPHCNRDRTVKLIDSSFLSSP